MLDPERATAVILIGFSFSNDKLHSICLRRAVNLSFRHVHADAAAAVVDDTGEFVVHTMPGAHGHAPDHDFILILGDRSVTNSWSQRSWFKCNQL